jgi:radical SAM protein with 4Fe4S-binding SPASM domain
MCPNSSLIRERGYMSWDLFKKIIGECKKFENDVDGLTFYLHWIGEPLLDSLLFERISYIKGHIKKSKISLNTNGSLLDEDKAKKLIDSGIDEITFSVDGTNSYSYDNIRKGLKYSIVENNINRYFELKEKYNKKIYTILQMVVYGENMNESDEFKRLWNNKADLVYIKSAHNFLDMNTSIKTKTLSSTQLYKCRQPYDFMLIYWNGDVGSCCWDYDNFAKVGNVRSNSLLEIYNNKKFRKIRHSMDNMNCKDIVPCYRCSQIYGEDIQCTR